jgi:hypothetical protein
MIGSFIVLGHQIGVTEIVIVGLIAFVLFLVVRNFVVKDTVE